MNNNGIKYKPIPIVDNLKSDAERLEVTLHASQLLGDIIYNRLYDNPKELENFIELMKDDSFQLTM